jgi:hypothetical protein
VGVGSGRCEGALGGKDGIGLDEKPGPLTLIDGAADLEGLGGDPKLMAGGAVEDGRVGDLLTAGGPLILEVGLIDGILDGCSTLMAGAPWKPGMTNAASGSSDNTGLGTPGSSGRQMVGMGGIGEEDRPGELLVGDVAYGVRCPLSRGGSILGMADRLKGDDLGDCDVVYADIIEEGAADGVGVRAGTRVSSSTTSFCCFQPWSKLTIGRPSLSLTAVG